MNCFKINILYFLLFFPFLVSCAPVNSKLDTIVGRLPVFNIGDTWNYKQTINSNVTVITLTITGETEVNGKDHYLATVQISSTDHNYPTVSYLKIDKEINEITENRMVKEREGKLLWIDLKESYIFSSPPYPLVVGKNWSVIKTTKIESNSNSRTSPVEKIEKYNYHIDGIENVTVPAGTFECFKFSKYNEKKELEKIYWNSIDGRLQNVKIVNLERGSTEELISFTLGKK